MIVMESRHARRLVVTLKSGEDVVQSVKKLAETERFRAAWVRGTGLLEWASMTDWDPRRGALRPPRHVEGPLALLALEGNVSIRLGEPYVELRAALSREGDTGLVAAGGQLVVASALNVELLLDVLEDVRLERDEALDTGLAVFRGEHSRGVLARRPGGPRTSPSLGEPGRHGLDAEPRDEPAPSSPEPSVPSPPASGGLDWAAVARASTRAEAPEASSPRRGSRPVVPAAAPPRDAPRVGAIALPDEEPQPKKGDWIEHRQFGLCRVEHDNVDGGILIRLPSGMRKVVHLEYLEVMPPRFDGDRRIFALRPRKR